MPYCHKRYYIAKGKCASVTEIYSFMLMVTMFILGASIRVRAPYRTRQSLILLHRCYAHYIPLTIVVLFVHHDTTPLCCVHVIVLPNRCASYYAHSSNVRPVFPVHILYFLQCLVYFGSIFVTESFVAFSTIIAWSYRAWQQTLCVSYYNIIYVLFLPLFTQQKHRVSASSRSK